LDRRGKDVEAREGPDTEIEKRGNRTALGTTEKWTRAYLMIRAFPNNRRENLSKKIREGKDNCYRKGEEWGQRDVSFREGRGSDLKEDSSSRG